MEHFYQKLQGFFSFPIFYSDLVKQAKDGYHFVEIGSWKGQSAVYMAVEIANSDKKIKFDCVDTWEGSEEHIDPQSGYYEPMLLVKDALYNHFLDNISPVKEYINKIVRQPSVEAAKLYEDNSLNCVYIDAAHDYKSVCDDIKAWTPKVKKGGLLSGHDYQSETVRRAVFDCCGAEAKLYHPSETVWVCPVR